MITNKKHTPSDLLVSGFLEQAKAFQANIELIKVLKSRTYKIAEANVLVRAASEANRRYFFGLNYLTAEEMNNIDNPFIAFICGSLDNILIMPAKVLYNSLSQISHDRNGEYKIIIDKDLNLVLLGKNQRLDCSIFLNKWSLLLQKFEAKEVNNTIEESLHSVLQGRLIEIGNLRGFKTFCPDKSKIFNDKKLGDITTVERCPELQFSDYNLLRKIDVLWFREKGKNLIPENAFEVEISTGTWSGVGRLATLMDYSNVGLFIISNEIKKYNQVMTSFFDYENRYKHIVTDGIGDLYSAEKNLKELRYSIGL